MIQRSQSDAVTNQRTVADINTTLVLKMTAGIDENLSAQMYIFTAVRVKRRKQAKTLIYLFSYQLWE